MSQLQNSRVYTFCMLWGKYVQLYAGVLVIVSCGVTEYILTYTPCSFAYPDLPVFAGRLKSRCSQRAFLLARILRRMVALTCHAEGWVHRDKGLICNDWVAVEEFNYVTMMGTHSK